MSLTACQTAALIPVFRRLALEAGDAIMQIYNSDDLGARLKGDASPVTLADEAADALIYKGLTEAFPEIPLITEEQPDSHLLEARSFFIVDPLDGTKEFVQRRGDFTVNIAYVENGLPRFGIVYAPAKSRLFYTTLEGHAVEEIGPFALDQPGEITQLKVAEPDLAALRVVASKSHRDKATDDYIAQYPVGDLKSAGSSLKFCLLATGEADFYPRLGRTMEWDTAAGDAVLRAAGGKTLNMHTLEPLAYGKAGWENTYFIATSPSIPLIPTKYNE